MKNEKLVIFCILTPIVVTVISILISFLCFFSLLYLLRDNLDNFYDLYSSGIAALSSTNILLGIFLYYIFFNTNEKVREDKKLSFYSFFMNIPTAIIFLLLSGVRVSGEFWWLMFIFPIPFVLLQVLVYKGFRKRVNRGDFGDNEVIITIADENN